MADIIQEIQDANGKVIPVDISKVCDISGDLGDGTSSAVNDNLQNRVAHVHDVVYVNQAGETIDNMKLVQDIQSGKASVAAIDVELEATHSGKNHNYCIYYEDSMEKDAETFVNPFKKPMLKNHDSYSEPLGRISQSWHGPSALTDERSAIHLKVRVTDQDAIIKFLDGRYSTVSIGGRMGTVTCNVCGKTILKDGKFKFCGHWRGESYKDQMCYWGARDITYNEVSTVNTPADDFAQVMKVTVVTDSADKKDSKEETTMAGTNTDSNHVDALKQISDMIDNILNPTPSASDSTGTPEAPEAKDGNGEETPKADEPKDDAATDELAKTKKDLADAQEKITSLETELQETKDALAKAQEDLTTATTDAAQFKEKCVTLATANKELVADGIIAKELVAGKIQEDAKDSRKEELVAMSMKDLHKLAEEQVTKDETTPRQPAQVTNPTLANPETKDSNGSADANKKTTDDNKAKKTVDDFAKDIVSKLVK